MARKGHRPSQAPASRPRFYGRHAVTAALANPERTVRKIWGTREAVGALALPADMTVTYADVADLARLVPSESWCIAMRIFSGRGISVMSAGKRADVEREEGAQSRENACEFPSLARSPRRRKPPLVCARIVAESGSDE